MSDCPVCSFQNPRSAAACGNCGADLRVDVPVPRPVPPDAQAVPYASGGWTDAPTAGPAVLPRWDRPPVADAPERGPDSMATAPVRAPRKGADLTLEPTELEVEPGATVTTTVTVHNLGEEVERFQLEVNGPGGSFATAEPPDLRMLPDKKQSATIRFTPARDPGQRAGPHPFQVVARSTVNPDVVQRGSGIVVVGAYAQLDAGLEPEVSRGRRPGTHRLQLVNAGNAPVRVSVELQDETGELVFDPSTVDETLDAGARQERPFSVAGPVPWFGRTKSFPFTAEVLSTGVPQPVQLQGVRRQVPRFPWWVPTVALALVAVAIALYALLPKGTLIPAVADHPLADAARSLEEAGFDKVVTIQKVSDKVAAGTAIGTDPAAPTRWPKHEPVTLYVSRGPCPGDCPPIVPNVVGLTAEEATTQLGRAGLMPRSLQQANAAPANTVFDTTPKAEQPAPDKAVTLMVSTGPESASASSGSGSSSSAGESSSSSAGAGGGGAGGAGGAAPPTMPSVLGQLSTDAQKVLTGAGLAVTTVVKHTSTADAGTVLDSTPKAGEPVKAGDTVTITVAQPVDFYASAEGASWQADGAKVDFPATTPPGARKEEAAQLEDTNTGAVLVLVPGAVAGSTVTGDYTIPEGIGDGDHLRGEIGFLSEGSDGAIADFTVSVDGEQVYTTTKPADGTLVTLDEPLTAKEGPVTVRITVIGAGWPAVWKDLRIETQ